MWKSDRNSSTKTAKKQWQRWQFLNWRWRRRTTCLWRRRKVCYYWWLTCRWKIRVNVGGMLDHSIRPALSRTSTVSWLNRRGRMTTRGTFLISGFRPFVLMTFGSCRSFSKLHFISQQSHSSCWTPHRKKWPDDVLRTRWGKKKKKWRHSFLAALGVTTNFSSCRACTGL